jgi:hypothetical protein
MLYDTKYCWWHITKPTPSIVAVVQHCRLHYTYINRLYTIPSIVGGILKADTKYCCSLATCLSGHTVDFTTHKSIVCKRYQVLLAAYYKADTKYCCCLATCLSGHIVDFATHKSIVCIRYQLLLAVYYKTDTKYRVSCVYNEIYE